eukprot:scaffold32325_cov56-Isochrysis_galbana.AAC.1
MVAEAAAPPLSTTEGGAAEAQDAAAWLTAETEAAQGGQGASRSAALPAAAAAAAPEAAPKAAADTEENLNMSAPAPGLAAVDAAGAAVASGAAAPEAAVSSHGFRPLLAQGERYYLRSVGLDPRKQAADF